MHSFSRRALLQHTACGFGSLALAGLACGQPAKAADPLAARPPLFPAINRHVDDLCFLHSMQTEGVAHGPATLFLHCGATSFIRPSIGSWVLYGLGSDNENLPGFVSIAPSAGNGGPRNYGNAFLPAVYQGTGLGRAGAPASEATIRDLAGPLNPAT